MNASRMPTPEDVATELGVSRATAYRLLPQLSPIKVHTFDAARGYGRMQGTTRERVLEALAREEAAP